MVLLDVCGVYEYIYIGGRSRSVEQRGAHEGGGRAHGGRHAPLPRGLLDCVLTSTPSPLDHVYSENHVPEGFIPFGLRLIFLSFETLIAKKTTMCAGPPVNRLVPKII